MNMQDRSDGFRDLFRSPLVKGRDHTDIQIVVLVSRLLPATLLNLRSIS